MQEIRPEKLYRIGDFAGFLGVTSEFLKHYESAGLVNVQQRESGYRFFPFNQSARIIECLRLRNYGFAVKEMSGLLSSNAKAAMMDLEEKTQTLRRKVERMQGIIAEQERIQDWYAKRQIKPIDWEIRAIEPYCFLPHTCRHEFLTDERIYDLLKEWAAWLPVTKSALMIEPSNERNGTIRWGLTIPESLLKAHRLPVNGSVIRLTFEKALVFHFCELVDAFKMEDIAAGRHPAFHLMRELGFRTAGTGLLINEMKFCEADGTDKVGVGRFIIPIC